MVGFFFALSSLQLFGCKITHYFRNFQEKAGEKENERVPAALSLNTTSIEKLLQLADTKNRKDLEDSEIVRKFAGEKPFFKNMLGIDTPHSPVGGKFAEEIRATIRRVSTGHLNEADKRRIRRSHHVLQKFDAVWE